jgi:hypothetical protein
MYAHPLGGSLRMSAEGVTLTDCVVSLPEVLVTTPLMMDKMPLANHYRFLATSVPAFDPYSRHAARHSESIRDSLYWGMFAAFAMLGMILLSCGVAEAIRGKQTPY